jgi:ABC-type branched-subunit amino acid transport system substrate-binding protein
VLLLISPFAYADSPRTLKVGGVFDLTGGAAIWGKSEHRAFMLACTDFEKKHADIKVETIVEDSQFSAKQTVSAFHKLTSIDGVSFIVGPTWETAVPMMPLCEAKRVVCLFPSYHSKEFYARPWKFSFSAWFDDRGYSAALAAKANERGIKDIAIFAAISPYYDALVENFTNTSTAAVVANRRVVLEERDFRSMIVQVPADVSAVLMLLDNAGQIQAFLKQWTELRKDRPVIFTDDLILYLQPPEDVRRGGFTFLYSYPVFDESLQKRFLDRFVGEYGEQPAGSSASVAYDETMLLLDCMRTSMDKAGVRECVAATKDYRGFSGVFSFNGGQTVTDRVIAVQQL